VVVRALDDGYELDDDPARIDVDAATAYLGGESYWARGRSRETMEQLVREATRVVGLYAPDGSMIGFARAVSDRHTFAYMADVYVLDGHRGRNFGVEIVRELIEHSDYPHVRWMLGTLDAHELYRKFGFTEPSERIMERPRVQNTGTWVDPARE
jgi:GNAT superfamily N-acetyltransferase